MGFSGELGRYLGNAVKIKAYRMWKRLFLLVIEQVRPADYQSGGLSKIRYCEIYVGGASTAFGLFRNILYLQCTVMHTL